MKNAVISALLVALVLVGLLAFWQIGVLKTQMANRAASEALDLQAKCAKQAIELVKHYWPDRALDRSYTSHYNKQTGKCFVHADYSRQSDLVIEVRKGVFDAFEFTELAGYSVNFFRDSAEGLPPTVSCRVTLLSGESKTCKSEEEYNALVKDLMER